MALDKASSLNSIVGMASAKPQEKIIDLTLSWNKPIKMAIYYDYRGDIEATTIRMNNIVCELKCVENKLQVVDVYYFDRHHVYSPDKQLSKELSNELKKEASLAIESILSKKKISSNVQEILKSMDDKVKSMENIGNKGMIEEINLPAIEGKKPTIKIKRELDSEGRLTKNIRFKLSPAVKNKSFLFEAVEKGNSFIVKNISIIEKDLGIATVHRTELKKDELEEIKPILKQLIRESDNLAVKDILTNILKKL